MNKKEYLRTFGRIVGYLVPGIMVSYLWCNLISPSLFWAVLDRGVFNYVLISETAIHRANYLIMSGANIKKWLRPDVHEDVSARALLHPELLHSTFTLDWLVLRMPPTDDGNIDEERSMKLSSTLVAVIANNWRPDLHTEGRLDLVKVVLSWGVDVNRPGTRMLTPFHTAMCFDRIEVIELLIRHGLVLNEEQMFQGAECALMNRSMRVISWMVDLQLVPEMLTTERQLFMSGPYLQYDIPAHSSLLHLACYFKNRQAVDMLRIKTNLDPELKNEGGKTPQDICRFN